MKMLVILAALAAGLCGCATNNAGQPCAIGTPCAGCLMCID